MKEKREWVVEVILYCGIIFTIVFLLEKAIGETVDALLNVMTI